MSEGAVLLEAAHMGLAVGDNGYLDCPFCGRKGKFSISRRSEGVLYHCFSSHCGKSGFIPDHSPGRMVRGDRDKSPVRSRRYIGELEQLDEEDHEFFQEKFGVYLHRSVFYPAHSVRAWDISVTYRGEYLFPIHNSMGIRVGEVLRQPTWEGCHREPVAGKPKALTFLDRNARRECWHVQYTLDGATLRPPRQVVVVEDQISAEKIRQHSNSWAVALLGQDMSIELAQEIQKMHPGQVVIWLDSDTGGKSYELVARYGSMYEEAAAVSTLEDPKDLSVEQIQEVLFD